MLALGVAHGAEGVEKALVAARRQKPPLNAQLFKAAGEAKAVHQHANAAHHAGLVHVNLVGGRGNVVGGGSAGVFHHRVNRLVMQFAQAADFVVHQPGLHRAAAGRINLQNQRLRAFIFHRAAQCGQQLFGIVFAVAGNFTPDGNDRRVRPRRRSVLRLADHHGRQSREKQHP